MELERMQCPSCGASITYEGRETVFCSYCGAKLMVRRGASGNPVAALDGIKADTGLLAREAAYARLGRELDALASREERIRQEAAAEETKVGAPQKGLLGWGLLLLLAGACGLSGKDYSSFCLVLPILGLCLLCVYGFDVYTRNQALQEIRTATQAQLGEVAKEADGIRAKMAGIKAEIDKAVDDL